GEETPIELALHVTRERRPVAAHDLHADELDVARGVEHPRITLARAARAVPRVRQEKLPVQLLELDLEATLDPPARLDVLREVHVQCLCELRPLLERALRVGAA